VLRLTWYRLRLSYASGVYEERYEVRSGQHGQAFFALRDGSGEVIVRSTVYAGPNVAARAALAVRDTLAAL
jgi:hypothetical protein